MFKKVKDKITDEVNLATNKLQNIQIIDQLATTIGQQQQQQFTIASDTIPYQTLPHFSNQQGHPDHLSSDMPKSKNQFSLVDVGNCEEDEELNSEISPQHQLFNESSIRPLNNQPLISSGELISEKDKMQIKSNGGQAVAAAMTQANPPSQLSDVEQQQQQQQNTVIDINHLSSDLETDIDDAQGDAKDDEIDPLSDKEVAPCTSTSNPIDGKPGDMLMTYKTRYRNIVHLTRRLNHDLRRERDQHESQVTDLKKQIAALKQHQHHQLKQQQLLHNVKNHSSDSIVSMNVPSDGSSETTTTATTSIKQHHNRQNSVSSGKLKDMEKLMAKCKESLKAKNGQIKILKDSLAEVDKFEEYMEGVKSELRELRNAHETWTLSIAENKRVMHQEIESKNFELDKLKGEIKELQNQLKDSNNKSLVLKSQIQKLESRLVSTSAAHQKERESLIKDLLATKNTAIKQLQRDHEFQLERVKLDLEKSIESVKSESLMKDEQIIRSAERQQQLQEQNAHLRAELESTKSSLELKLGELIELKCSHDTQGKELVELKDKLQNNQSEVTSSTNLKLVNEELEVESRELSEQLEELTRKLTTLETTNHELEEEKLKLSEKLNKTEQQEKKICERCQEFENQLNKNADSYEQSLFELNAKLKLMTTANTDQEKQLHDIKCERDKAIESQRELRLDLEELNKKSESLSHIIQDNENELQQQQEQLNQMMEIKQQLECLKRENISLTTKLTQVHNELNERQNDLNNSQQSLDELHRRLVQVELESQSISKTNDSLKSEKDYLSQELVEESKRRYDLNQQLVVSILSAMKNLETPDTSPGSDKNYNTTTITTSSQDHDHGHDSSSCEPKSLPDPVRLAEELSSLALDRSSAYVNSNQRLQAVLLDNSMINEELKRLKEELNALNKERTNEVMCSLEEVERLRTENQALIHDQKAYDDRIQVLEDEIEQMRQLIAELPERQAATTATLEASTTTSDYGQDDNENANEVKENLSNDLLMIKEQEIERLKEILADKDKQLLEQSHQQQQAVDQLEEVPDPTEFKYLKNIVYQFMMGKEPTTLARVISAVFKFEEEQVEQICRVQDAIHQISG